MLDFTVEKEIFGRGAGLIGAIDEAGRGPLAGPVVAACVLVEPGFNYGAEDLKWVRDSKKLSSKRRAGLFEAITGSFSAIGVGICEPDTIDRMNILQASFLAMKKAIGALKAKPDYIILDGGLTIPNTTINQTAIKRGDATVFSIAAASIIAKVTRDRIMLEWHERFPDYGFDKHKGYGTKLHMDSLEKHGPCPIHRKSFAPVRKLL